MNSLVLQPFEYEEDIKPGTVDAYLHTLTHLLEREGLRVFHSDEFKLIIQNDECVCVLDFSTECDDGSNADIYGVCDKSTAKSVTKISVEYLVKKTHPHDLHSASLISQLMHRHWAGRRVLSEDMLMDDLRTNLKPCKRRKKKSKAQGFKTAYKEMKTPMCVCMFLYKVLDVIKRSYYRWLKYYNPLASSEKVEVEITAADVSGKRNLIQLYREIGFEEIFLYS
jgi:hypothetical protein